MNSVDVDSEEMLGVDLNTEQLNCLKFHSAWLVVILVSHLRSRIGSLIRSSSMRTEMEGLVA